jgi:hypothetical protein
MKFEELVIGVRYYIDESERTGVLLDGGSPELGPGFKVDQEDSPYFEDEDGLVRFSLNDTFNYPPVELDSEEIEN